MQREGTERRSIRFAVIAVLCFVILFKCPASKIFPILSTLVDGSYVHACALRRWVPLPYPRQNELKHRAENNVSSTEYFKLPVNRVLELGARVEI
jgi:K+ transporter